MLASGGVANEIARAVSTSRAEVLRGEAGTYPSKGATGERGAWFRDSEGNLLEIGQLVR